MKSVCGCTSNARTLPLSLTVAVKFQVSHRHGDDTHNLKGQILKLSQLLADLCDVAHSVSRFSFIKMKNVQYVVIIYKLHICRTLIHFSSHLENESGCLSALNPGTCVFNFHYQLLHTIRHITTSQILYICIVY